MSALVRSAGNALGRSIRLQSRAQLSLLGCVSI